nr:MAG TPA: hypothetical protein [Caudoviricetes sp.]
MTGFGNSSIIYTPFLILPPSCPIMHLQAFPRQVQKEVCYVT